MFQDIIFEFDHGLYLRDSAFENKACNIYHLLVKVQKSPRRFTVLPMTPQPHIHTHPCTHTPQYCLAELKKMHKITVFAFLISSNIWTRLFQFPQKPREFSTYPMQLKYNSCITLDMINLSPKANIKLILTF